MPQKTYNKLVRDNIPGIIEKNGGAPKLHVLGEAEYVVALKEKMLEEAQELLAATSPEDVMNELADILEVAEAVAVANALAMVHAAKAEKKEKRGGFEKRLFLEYVDEP